MWLDLPTPVSHPPSMWTHPHICTVYTQTKYVCEYMKMDVCESKRKNYNILTATLSKWLYHVRYLSHLTLQVESSDWVHKTWIHPIQRWHHFGAKTIQSAFLLEKRLHPFLYWIRYSWSGSTHILYYIYLSVSWNTLLRNQISSCQYIFYYNWIFDHFENLTALAFRDLLSRAASIWSRVFSSLALTSFRWSILS